MLLAWLTIALGVECKEPIPLDELARSLDVAEQAYIDFDDTGFRDQVNILSGVHLPCVGDPVAPALVRRTHTVIGLHFLAMGDEANAELSIKAAHAADPDARVDRRLIPEGHPADAWWVDEETAEKTRKVPEPRVGSVAFDGEHTRARRAELPAVFQLFDETGRARSTQYLGPRQPLPSYAAIPRQRNILLGCSAGSVAASAALLGGSWAARGSLIRGAQDPTTAADVLDGRRASMNGMAVASAALFGVGTGCGVGAYLIGER
jgi:hypothetical protein